MKYNNLIQLLKDINVILPDGFLNSNLKIILKKHIKISQEIINTTNFLDDVSLKQRVYTIINNITSVPTCNNKECNNRVKFNRKYNRYCSNKCIGQDENIQQKKRETCLNNYDVESPSQSPIVQEKTKRTCLERLGVENPFQSPEIKEKIIQTNLNRLGVKNPAQSPKIKEKAKQTNLEHCGYENPFQSPEIQKKSRQSMLDHIETQNYYQSIGEKQVLEFINSLNIETISNSRKIINPYELDIYIPSHKLAFEYCGLYWHAEQTGKDKHYHKKKHDLCKEKGIQLITVFEDEWDQRQEQVKSKIRSLFNVDPREKIFARKTTIVNITRKTKQLFYEINHIQGDGQSSINIGLLYDNELVACMSFIKRVDDRYELNRYATSARVIGGFSKLLKHFENNYNPKEIVSFADLRWSNGNLYIKTGWEIDSLLKPDYSYSRDGIHRVHKFNYRRKNLPYLLFDFDPALSEKLNCDYNGILRIWDCGKIRFIKKY